MKKKLLLTSILSIVMCFSLICGATFALFTSESTVNIAVTSGNVEVVATISDLTLYSKGEEQAEKWANGGTAIATDNTLTLSAITPGDKVEFNINVENKSNVNIQYRTVFNCDDGIFLATAFDTTVGNVTEQGLIKCVTAWVSPVNGKIASVKVAIDFPYLEESQDMYKNQSAKFSFTVEAIQGNADAIGEAEIKTATAVKNTEELQTALDCAKNGDIIMLVPEVEYGVVYMGRPTANNDTTMTCDTHSYFTANAEEFKTHLNNGTWHCTPRYTTNLNNLTIIGAEGATVAGLIATSGHAYGDVYDYVIDKDYDVGSAYYNTLNINNVLFSNVNFTGKVNINTSDATSVYDGVTFDACTFTTGGTASANGAAIRYYNESNNGNVKNIVVKNCKFNNCYQGVYVHQVNGVTVTGSTFDTTGHNAIAIQYTDAPVDLKNVVITDNTFKNIDNRVIRFGQIGADSNITIQNNTATDSGDEDGEMMRAVSIAAGATISISGNSWDGGIETATAVRNRTAVAGCS